MEWLSVLSVGSLHLLWLCAVSMLFCVCYPYEFIYSLYTSLTYVPSALCIVDLPLRSKESADWSGQAGARSSPIVQLSLPRLSGKRVPH